MRFGKTENNQSLILWQIVLALFIFGSCAFSVACQSKQQKIDAALQQCQKLLDTDDVAQAYKCYLKVGKTYPENDPYIVDTGDKAIFKKCVEFKERKDFEQAAFCFEGLTKLRPNSATIYFQIAESYYNYYKENKEDNDYSDAKLLKKAEVAIKKCLEIDSETPIFVETYGEILAEKGDWQGALREHLKAVKLAPNEGWMWIKLAFVQEKLNFSNEATESYKKALAINPKDTTALYFLGALYEKQGKLDEAIETIENQKELESLDNETEQRLKTLKDQRKIEQERKPNKPKTKSATGGATVSENLSQRFGKIVGGKQCVLEKQKIINYCCSLVLGF